MSATYSPLFSSLTYTHTHTPSLSLRRRRINDAHACTRRTGNGEDNPRRCVPLAAAAAAGTEFTLGFLYNPSDNNLGAKPADRLRRWRRASVFAGTTIFRTRITTTLVTYVFDIYTCINTRTRLCVFVVHVRAIGNPCLLMCDF